MFGKELSRVLRTAMWATALAVPLQSAHAQNWPTKPVTVITAGAAGDGLDVIARVFAQSMSKELGQPVLVDNRPGGGGRLAMTALKNAPKDGYTIGLLSLNNIPLPAVNSGSPYDPVKDFSLLSLAAEAIPMLVISPEVPAKTLPELVAYAKANPGRVNYGSSGSGSIFHFYGEWLNQSAGINVTHVAYKGEAAAITDLISGRIQYMFASGIAKQYVVGRKINLAATAGPQRMSDFPETPTLQESGLPDFVMTGWIGFAGPAGLSKPVGERLTQAVVKAAAAPEVKTLLANFTFIPIGSTSDVFGDRVRTDLQRLKTIGSRGAIHLE